MQHVPAPPRPRRLNAALATLLLCTGLWLPASAQTESPLRHDPPLQLAQLFAEHHDPRHYWVSEKLDGVRALWDGQHLRFRSGAPIAAPAWFVAALPDQALDGELWLARGEFERLSGIVRSLQADDEAWRQVRFMVFDLPGAPGTFTERLAHLRTLLARHPVPWVAKVPQYRVSGRAELERTLTEVVNAGGEGLMLHHADARWSGGRTHELLKLKPWFDAEARVIGHTPGKGRYTGMMGALIVETPEGLRFRLGTGFTDAERRHPPALGQLVTYRYRGLTRTGKPRFASYWRIRDEP